MTEALAVIESAEIVPAFDLMGAVEMYKQFEEAKKELLTEDDMMKIKGKPYIKKSGWRKIKTAFGIRLEILSRERMHNENIVTWIYRTRASTPQGMYADAEMCASSNEPFSRGKGEAVCMAMAQTRSFNRSISDLCGGGAVSAEEIPAEESPPPPKKKVIPKAPVMERDYKGWVKEFEECGSRAKAATFWRAQEVNFTKQLAPEEVTDLQVVVGKLYPDPNPNVVTIEGDDL